MNLKVFVVECKFTWQMLQIDENACNIFLQKQIKEYLHLKMNTCKTTSRLRFATHFLVHIHI